MINEKKITADDYGFFLLSLDVWESFLKKKKIKTKKIFSYLSKNKDFLHECIQNGVLIPINQISVFNYQLFINTEIELDKVKNDWEIVFEEGIFNLKIGADNKLWFISFSQFYSWNHEKFLTTEDFTGYWVESGPNGDSVFEYTGQRFNIPTGEYFVKVCGLKRKRLTNNENNDFGFLFQLKETKSITENYISPEINPSFYLGYD